MSEKPSPIAAALITGVVLCGGRGSRLGGVDKGLQPLRGQPLVQHAMDRLRPQVGALLINANRHLEIYRSLGTPVVSDAEADFPGPLAGWLAAMENAHTPYLVAAPCDTPGLPLDLVSRLAQALTLAGAGLAVAATREEGVLRLQPVFCLMKVDLKRDLAACLRRGERQVGRWTAQQQAAVTVFEDDGNAFFNINTPADLARLERDQGSVRG